MSLDRLNFFAAAKFPVKSVDLPDGNTVHVRAMSAGDRDRFGFEAGDSPEIDATARLVAATASNSRGELLFTREDIPKLSELPVTFLQPIAEAALVLNSMGAKAVEDLRKNSESDPG